MPYSFVFDQNRCTGCQACQLACTIENGLEPTQSWRSISTFNEQRSPEAPVFHLSLACNHCAHPACMEACPAAAYRCDEDTGAVLLDSSRCIGCTYCAWACPYEAPRFDAAAGVMSKCTFCNDRIKEGRKPACAELCPTGALDFTCLKTDEITQEGLGFPDTGLQPSIRIIGLRTGAAEPEIRRPEEAVAMAIGSGASPTIGLRSEWSLAAFTWLAALLVALMTAATAGKLTLHPTAFGSGAGAAMLLATAHLGRKSRAWRAVLNLRTSWLSREIVAFSTFVGLGVVHLTIAPALPWLGWAAALTGLGALLCMDRVYHYLVRPGSTLPHSASVVLMGLFMAALLAGASEVATLAGLVKLGLYADRKRALARAGLPVRLPLSSVRVGIGLLLPAALWPLPSDLAHALAIVAVLAGEAIDRGEFYTELKLRTPRRRMAIDLAARLADSPV